MPVVMRNSPIFVPASNAVSGFFDFTTAAVENPLSYGGAFTQPLNSAYSAMRVANGSGGRACYGNATATSTSDALTTLAGNSWLPNQKVTVKFIVNGTTGASELEIHLNSYGDASNQFSYEFDIINLQLVWITKWCGGLGTVFQAFNGTASSRFVTDDLLVCESSGPALARRLQCTFIPVATGIPEVLFDVTDDGSATWGSIPPLTAGNPGLGGDDAGPADNGGNDYSLNLGFKTCAVVTRPLG